MKFQWYVVDLEEGSVQGSNDVDVVRPYITDDQYLVFTAQHGKYYLGSTTEKEVKELTVPTDGDLKDLLDED